MAANFTVDQEVLDAVVAHLQEKGLQARIRPLEGFAPLIEAVKDGHSLQLDAGLFSALSKEDALNMADTALSGFGGQDACTPCEICYPDLYAQQMRNAEHIRDMLRQREEQNDAQRTRSGSTRPQKASGATPARRFN